MKSDHDADNNTFTNSAIRVKLLGDVNNDGKVDASDLFQLEEAFGSTGGPPPSAVWNLGADLNGNNIINPPDLSALNKNYGKNGLAQCSSDTTALFCGGPGRT